MKDGAPSSRNGRWVFAAALLIGLVALTALLTFETPRRQESDDNALPEVARRLGHQEVIDREEVGAGRWARLPAEPIPEGERPGLIARWLGLDDPHLGTPMADASGVTLHRRGSASAGYNLFASGHAPEAVLMDMDGNELHRWNLEYSDVWPTLPAPNSDSEWWRRVHLFENGDLLALYEGFGLIKLDQNSKLLWASRLRAHHDIAVHDDGEIYVLTREVRRIPRLSEDMPIHEDSISVLGSGGQLLRRFSLLEAYENSRFASQIFQGKRRHGDIFRTNSIAVLDGTGTNLPDAFAKGRVLTSMNALGTVAVVDLEGERVVWSYGSRPAGQHDPSLLASGNILLFVNNELSGQSEVIEFDPHDREVNWSYRGDEAHPFYSMYRGAAQRLPNGNTLITESDGGRAFEVTRAGEIVWEFFNPHRAGEKSEFIAILPEVVRLPKSFPIEWTQARSDSASE